MLGTVDRVPVARPARADVGPGVAVPRGVRGDRRCAFGHLARRQGVPWLRRAARSPGWSRSRSARCWRSRRSGSAGLYLALATFGFGVALSYMLYTQEFMFGDTGEGVDLPRPGLGLDGDSGLLLRRPRLRRGRDAVRRARWTAAGSAACCAGWPSRRLALATSGVSVNVTCVLVFCLRRSWPASAARSSAPAQQTVTADSYPPLLSLTCFVLVVIVARARALVRAAGAAPLVLVPSYVDGCGHGRPGCSCCSALAAVDVRRWPRGLPARVPHALRAARSTARSAPVPTLPAAVARGRGARPAARRGALELARPDGPLRRLIAVDGAEPRAPTGRITGLIGPTAPARRRRSTPARACVRPASGTRRARRRTT